MLLKIVRTQSRVATPNSTCSGRTWVWRGWRFIVTDNLKCGDREDGCLSSCHPGRKVAPHCYNTAATKVFCQGNMLEKLKPRGTQKTVITQFITKVDDYPTSRMTSYVLTSRSGRHMWGVRLCRASGRRAASSKRLPTVPASSDIRIIWPQKYPRWH